MDLLVTCSCGHRITVSEFAMGMTAPCPACKLPLTVATGNARPIESKPKSPPPQTPASESYSSTDIVYTPIQTTSLKSHCARCGKEFRGDWDRHQSSLGLICNICSNRVRQENPLQTFGYVPPVDSMKLEPQIDTVPFRPVEVEEAPRSWRDRIPDDATMRRIAIGAAVAFMLYTVYLIISGAWIVEPNSEEAELAAESAAAEIPELPRWAGITVKLLGAGSGLVSTLAGLYIFLSLGQRLPEESWLANIIRLLPAAAIITAIYWAPAFLLGPIAGIIVILVFAPPIVFISFGLEGQDIINFPIGMLLGALLQSLFYLLIYWVIGTIAL